MRIIKNAENDVYTVTLLVAKRARDLIDKKPPLIKPADENPISQAVDEWMLGLIKPESKESPEK